MAKSNAVLPLGVALAWGTIREPMHSTRILETASRIEYRTAYWPWPRYKYRLHWDVLRDDRAAMANATPATPKHELRELVGFFNQRRGAFESFLFDDESDREVSQQVIATGDGATRDFALVRAYGGSVEPIHRPNAIGQVRVNGTPTVLYTANTPYEGWIRFNTAPANGHVIDWSGTYYWRVRFLRDDTEFGHFEEDLWSNRRLELITSYEA